MRYRALLLVSHDTCNEVKLSYESELWVRLPLFPLTNISNQMHKYFIVSTIEGRIVTHGEIPSGKWFSKAKNHYLNEGNIVSSFVEYDRYKAALGKIIESLAIDPFMIMMVS